MSTHSRIQNARKTTKKSTRTGEAAHEAALMGRLDAAHAKIDAVNEAMAVLFTLSPGFREDLAVRLLVEHSVEEPHEIAARVVKEIGRVAKHRARKRRFAALAAVAS